MSAIIAPLPTPGSVVADYVCTSGLPGASRTATLIDTTCGRVREDRWVVLVVIAIALVLAVGLATAWWITCQNKGLYPALDMPSFNDGGTWKAYCKK